MKVNLLNTLLLFAVTIFSSYATPIPKQNTLTNLSVNSINIVAAENFYGELATEIGGKYVNVHNIIDNHNTDPHLFTTSPSISKAIANAQIIIYNGASYDPWMQQILNAQTNNNIIIINVANLVQIKNGCNPHIWYKPSTMPILANYLANKLIMLHPEAKEIINNNLKHFLNNQEIVNQKISTMRNTYQGVYITATEPIFGYMAEALGLNMQGLDFQWKTMNSTEPSPKMLAQYQTLFTKKIVKLLLYNDQVTNDTTKNILNLAKQNNIPIVGISETLPQNTTINNWFLNELTKTDNILKMAIK